MNKLDNIRHEKFCQNLAKGMNQTEAYIKAGYQQTSNADNLASRLSSNVKIVQRLNSLREQTHKDYEISRNKIMMLLDNMIDADVITVSETELADLPKPIRMCVKKLKKTCKVYGEEKEETTYELELYDKQKAIEIINKMMGYNEPEKVKLEGELGLLLNQIMK